MKSRQRLISTLLIIALVLTLVPMALGNNTGGGYANPQPLATTSASLPRNIDADLMDALDTVVSHYISNTISNTAAPFEIPGAVVMVVHNGEIIAEGAWGYAHLTDASATGHSSMLDQGALVVNAARNAEATPGFYGGQLLADPVPMTLDTLFDMASVTKAMATTLGMMYLVDQGYVSLDDTVGSLLSDFAGGPLDDATVAQLLSHRSGIAAWEALYLFIAQDRGDVRDYLSGNNPGDWPGRPVRPGPIGEYVYSDLGYWVLGFIIEELSGMCLNDFVMQRLYQPLGLTDTMFVPLEHGIPYSRIAATTWGDVYEMTMVDNVNLPGSNILMGTRTGVAAPHSVPDTHLQDYLAAKDAGLLGGIGWRTSTHRGQVNDVNSGLGGGGISGHAGLFSTAGDMAVMGQLLLGGGIYNGVRLFSEETVETFLTPLPGMGTHGLGFRFNQPWMGWPQDRGSFHSFGHDGFTGTQVWFDQELNMQIIVLTNRQNIGYIVNSAVGGTQMRLASTNVLAQGGALPPPHGTNTLWRIAPRVGHEVITNFFGGGLTHTATNPLGRDYLRHREILVPANAGTFSGVVGTTPTREIVITNNGTARIVDLQATLVGDYFEIVGAVPTSIWPGSTVTITVRPVSGLAIAGSPYLGSLELTGQQLGNGVGGTALVFVPFDHDIDLSFTATAPPPGGGGGGGGGGTPIPTPTPTPPEPPAFPFDDVGEGRWYRAYIERAFDYDIMRGVTDTEFQPDGTLTRAQVAAVLFRMAGEPNVNFTPAFSDVHAHQWFAQYVTWATSAGVVQGFPDGSFGPNQHVTREQFAAMLHRFAVEVEDIDTSVPDDIDLSEFSDHGDVSSWAEAYKTWAVYAELILGTGGNLNPGGTTTRAQAAAILVRAVAAFR